MRSSFLQGTLVVEGVPAYDDFRDAYEYLREQTALWVEPGGFDAESGLASFTLVAKWGGDRPYRFVPRSGPHGMDEDRAGELTRFVEELFDGAVEFHEVPMKIGSPWLSKLGVGHLFDKAKPAMVTREEYEAAIGLGPAGEEASLESALAELDALVGLEDVKRRIHEVVTLFQNRGKAAMPCLHMAFLGNPGTGKTEVARIYGRILRGLGVLRSGQFVETDRSGLVGQYVGHTAQLTKAMVSRAMGGVLFVDEAYSLGAYASDLGSNCHGESGRRDFGPEAIDVLVKQMEDHRAEFACVMAGYPREMERMMDVNPGLRDRIAMTVEFPDYSAEELAAIFEVMVSGMGYELTCAAYDAVLCAVADVTNLDTRTFGNARFMRKLAERVVMKQNLRTGGYTLEECDVAAALADNDLGSRVGAERRVPVGFALA